VRNIKFLRKGVISKTFYQLEAQQFIDINICIIDPCFRTKRHFYISKFWSKDLFVSKRMNIFINLFINILVCLLKKKDWFIFNFVISSVHYGKIVKSQKNPKRTPKTSPPPSTVLCKSQHLIMKMVKFWIKKTFLF
jgi:hypothetical protein